MSEFTIELMRENIEMSYIISILVNIIISIFAFIPSFFLTAANILVFGFWEGFFLSLIGEVIGSVVSFHLYRIGIRKFIPAHKLKNKYIQKLLLVEGMQAYLLIVSLRLLPFMPSGLVNIGAAFGSVSTLTFGLATLIGKIPALLIEAFAVNNYLLWEGDGKQVLTLLGIVLIGGYLLSDRYRKNSKGQK